MTEPFKKLNLCERFTSSVGTNGLGAETDGLTVGLGLFYEIC